MKRYLTWCHVGAIGCVFLGGATARADVKVLDFEGLANNEMIAGFYDGGVGSAGSGPGPAFGVTFSGDALALIDADDGGTGNFANEPSAPTIMFWLTQNPIMNVAAGFTTGMSMFYTSINAVGGVNVYDGLNATGNLLASIPLAALGSAGAGDPTGTFDTWAPVGVVFAGTGLSIQFTGTANQIGFDDVTFGSATPGGTAGVVPIPGAVWLGVMGLGMVGSVRKRLG